MTTDIAGKPDPVPHRTDDTKLLAKALQVVGNGYAAQIRNIGP